MAKWDLQRVLLNEYLEARSSAWESGQFAEGHFMDPILTDFRGDPKIDVMCWLAFMAGSDWERKYVGPRYVAEATSTTPRVDLLA